MTRVLKDSWLDTYVRYASHTEAPRIMHFWCGVWAVAGCLRRKVWIDQIAFKWYPNFFVVLVAPPGIVSKSTSAGMAGELLQRVPGIKFGPDVVTWPALVTAFANACESFEYKDSYYPMSALNLLSSEFGNLIDPQDKGMINLFIDLWDGRKTLDKQTKTCGNDIVEGPWINLVGCTTPHWIADNMPISTIGGGFTSRCVFVYADTKEKLIPYPKFNFPSDSIKIQDDLVNDLEHIAIHLCGEYELTERAILWGTQWYEDHWKMVTKSMDDDKINGYMARKQTHLHKLAIVIAAATRDDLIISVEDLQVANQMLTSTEESLVKVFSRIGKSEISLQVDRLISFVRRYGDVDYVDAYQAVHASFPDFKEYENVLNGAIRAGYLKMYISGNSIRIKIPDVKGETNA